MSSYNYTKSKETAIKLVTKFGTDCKIITPIKTVKALCVFMSNNKKDSIDAPTQQTTKKVYVAGVDLEISVNNRFQIRQDIYLITSVDLYNFDNSTKVLYVLTLAQ